MNQNILILANYFIELTDNDTALLWSPDAVLSLKDIPTHSSILRYQIENGC